MNWPKTIKQLDEQTAEWLGGSAEAPTLPLTRADVQCNLADELVSFTAPYSFAADQYRTLRHTVDRWRRDNGLRVMAVTSSVPGDGKSITALNLAGTLAQNPRARILIVDADLRRPSVGKYLGLDELASPGLSGAILESSTDLAQAVIRLDRFNLSVLPAGPPPSDPYEMLNSSRLEALIADLRRAYDCVVFDTPPLLPFPDSRALGRWMDGYLLVIGAHKTQRKLVAEALRVVDDKKLIGIVFNGDDRPRSSHYGYHGYYTSGGMTPHKSW